MANIKYLFSLLVLSVFPFFVTAQSGTTSVGSTLTNGEYTVSYAVGESITSSYGNTESSITLGVIQPNIQVISSSNEISSDAEYLIFPNPTYSVVHVRSEDSRILKYEILSIDGKIIKKGNVNNGKINMDQIDNGIYIIKIESSESIYSTLIQKLYF